MPKVSIIIAIYNVEEYLPSCLDSVLNQSYANLQVIAVNDGSQDNSLPIIRAYARRDSRIYILDKPNGGLSDARNAGMEAAEGDYIAFLDGDDTYHPDFVAEMLSLIGKTKCDLACCNYSYLWKNQNKAVEKNFLRELPPLLNKKQAISAFLRQEIIGSVTIKMFRKSICDEYRIRFPKGQNWEDITFTFDYLNHAQKVCILKKSLYNYIQTESSITRKKESLDILDLIKAAKGCVTLNQERYPSEFQKENAAIITRAFICLIVYSFKCKDKKIQQRLKEELCSMSRQTSVALLSLPEKLLILLYRTHYSLAQWVFIHIYKRNQPL